jgi:hypothetical protein
MYFFPELNLWQNPAKKLSNFCSGSLDITTLPKPLLFSINQQLADIWFSGRVSVLLMSFKQPQDMELE